MKQLLVLILAFAPFFINAQTSTEWLDIGGEKVKIKDYPGAIKALTNAINTAESNKELREAYFCRAITYLVDIKDSRNGCKDLKMSAMLKFDAAIKMLPYYCN